MKQLTMRILDRWVGRLLSPLFIVYHFIFTAFLPKRPLPPIKKILFIKLIEQGTSVLAYGALQKAISLVGKENVYFLVFQENRPILDIMEIIPPENIISVRNLNFFRLSRDLLAAIRFCRSQSIDAVINMEFFARAPELIGYLTGATRRVGFYRFTSEDSYIRNLITHRVQFNPHLHIEKNYQLLVESLIRSPEEIPLPKIATANTSSALASFKPTEEDIQRVSSLLHPLIPGGPKRSIILLNPNAGDLMPLRKWPAGNFIQLAKRLLSLREDLIILLTGNASEAEATNTIAQLINAEDASSRVASVAGKTTLRDLLTLYSMADVLVTNDSGPGHFASLTPIQAIVLFGPETPLLFGPLGPHIKSLSAGLACSPCLNVMNNRHSPCKNNICMQAISVEHVVSAALECLV